MTRTVFVTAGAGSLGSHLVDFLVERATSDDVKDKVYRRDSLVCQRQLTRYVILLGAFQQ